MPSADIDWYRVTMSGLSSVFSRHWLVQGHNVWSIQCLQQTLIGTGSQCLVYPVSTADIDWYRVIMCGLSSVYSRHWVVQGHNVWSIQCLQQTLIGTGSQCLVYPMSTADIDWYRVIMCGLSSVYSRHWVVQGHNVWSIQCLQQTLIGTGS